MVETEPGGKNASPITDGRNTPATVITAKWLFVLLGTIWLVFGVSSIMRIGGIISSVSPAVQWLITIMMFVNALLLIWIGWGLGRGSRLYFYFGLLVLAGNVFLTFTDEFGTLDLITLIINVILLVMLILGHSKFLQN
jgi:hypothetical protein